MSDEEEEVMIYYPSGKVGAITRTKNEITKVLEDNLSTADPDELTELKNKLISKIVAFEDACDKEEAKAAPQEDSDEFLKWKNKQVIGNKLFINKLDKIILENSDGYEDEDRTSEEDEDEDNANNNNNDGNGRNNKEQNEDNGDVYEKLIDCFKTMQVSSHLPYHEPQLFDGKDVTEYQTFELTFKQTIEKKCTDYDDKYYYLLKYTAGEANVLVRSCHNENGKKAFMNAKTLLREKYGNEYSIAQQYIHKLQNWPSIKAEDGPGLSSFATFLTAIENMMKNMTSLNQLNSPRDIKEIVMKLPYQMRIQFRNKSAEMMENNSLLDFSMLVKFVNQQSKRLNVPVFGDISDRKTVMKRNSEEQYHKRSNDHKSKIFFTSDNSSNGKYCQCCKKNNHVLNDCYFFIKKTHAQKEDFIKQRNLCFSCLKADNHYAKDCTDRLTCNICGKNHPSCLHRNLKYEKQSSNKNVGQRENEQNKEVIPRNMNLMAKGTIKIACPAIPVILRSKHNNNTVRTYAALDSYSTASYMDLELVKKLNIKGENKSVQITTIDDNKIMINTVLANNLELMSIDQSTTLSLSSVYAKEKWPFTKDDSPSYNDIKHIKEFDDIPFNFINNKIGILIGMNEPDVVKPLEIIQPIKDGPYASRHMLGWAVNGPICGTSSRNKCFRAKTEELDLETKFNKVFNTDFHEEEITTKSYSPDEQQWLSYVNDNCFKLDINKYEINLPIKNNVYMPNNLSQVYKRLLSTKKKLLEDEELQKEYIKFMQMMKERGYMERVPDEYLNSNQVPYWYLTHHGVRHKRKGKLRIVFDCSLKHSGVSLNDMLWKGPDLTSSLTGVLLRFRKNKIAVSGDIEKMFYNVQVPKKDRTYLRFLWYDDDDFDLEPTHYWLTVHLFGASSSPAIANFALKKCASGCDAMVSDAINESFYVDDLLVSYDNEEEAIENVNKVRSALKSASFNLTSFSSNSEYVLKSMTNDYKENDNTTVNMPELKTTGALGMKWNTIDDTIGYEVKLPDQPNTKRGVLSTIFSIYDPLFLATPAVIRAKRIFQITCSEKLEWDEPLSCDLMKAWKQWKEEAAYLCSYKIPRCYKPVNCDEYPITDVQLHVFTDGSEVAYGAVAYLLYEDESNNISTSIVMSKSRLTPVDKKSLKTVPRIELNAAKLGVILYEKIMNEMNDTQIQKVFFWTDSKTTLQYILNESRQLQRFVANRVAYITSKTDVNSWRHVPGDLNPADKLSRGVTKISNFINDETWIHGPVFLKKPQNEWPSNKIVEEISAEDPEVKRKSFILSTKSDEIDSFQVLLNSTSDFHTLTCRIAVFLRLKNYLLNKIKKTGRLTTEELSQAEIVIWKYNQRTFFSDVIHSLSLGNTIPRASCLVKLKPFVSEDGLLRVGGRLTNAELPYSAKYPIILHASSHPVMLLMDKIHKENGHLGRETVLTKLKENFHIVKANKIVRQILDKCVTCKRVQGKPSNQQMSDLPADRLITDSPPFTNTATDIFGPFYVSKGRGKCQEKRYGVIFSCLVSRATHIEVTPGLDTNSYINAFRRFIARRGKPKLMRSDNGTNLTSSEKELRKAIDDWNHDNIHEFCLQSHIEWKFQPPQASHFGGVFERQIRTIRKIFNSILCDNIIKTKLSDDLLSTLFIEIENIMNNIPLTIVTSDVHDNVPLTPNTLLRMQSKFDFPPCDTAPSVECYYKKSWKRVQYLADVFWRRYRREYLPLITPRQKWNVVKRSVSINDIVLITDVSTPRNQWCIGRVISVNESVDGLVRSASVLVANNKHIKRPIHKLIVLVESDNE